jgi:hypothetical protein
MSLLHELLRFHAKKKEVYAHAGLQTTRRRVELWRPRQIATNHGIACVCFGQSVDAMVIDWTGVVLPEATFEGNWVLAEFADSRETKMEKVYEDNSFKQTRLAPLRPAS